MLGFTGLGQERFPVRSAAGPSYKKSRKLEPASAPALAGAEYRQLVLVRVQHPERAAAIGPDQHQRVLPFGNVRERLDNVGCGLCGMPIHLDNHVAALQPSVVGRATRLDILDYRSMDVARNLQLVAITLLQVPKAQAPAALSVFAACGLSVGGFAHGLQRDWKALGLAIAHDVEVDGVAGPLLPDFHLQFASISNRLAIQLDYDVASFQSSLSSGGVWLDLSHQRTRGIRHLEELRIIGSNIRNADTDIAVAD